MLTVTQSQDGNYLLIKSHYFYSDRIKKVPTATWNSEGKFWTINKAFASELEQRFHDEIYYKTPEWVIFNQPAPDYSKMYQIDSSIQAPSLKLNLYDYQEFGARFIIDRMNKHGFCILADDVGLGKTPISISVLLDRTMHHGAKKILIICKKSIKSQWEDELKKFTDLDKTFVIARTGDTKKKRMDAYKVIQDNSQSILITNYHTFLNDESIISSLGFDFGLIDEAHCISGHTTKMNKLIQHTVANKPCLFLTGTPVMNKPEQVYGIVSIASPKYFGGWTKFKKDFVVEAYQGNYIATIGAKNLSKLRSMIQDVMIRRTEYEVSVQLPKTLEYNIDCTKDKVQEDIIEAIKIKRESLMQDFESKMTIWQQGHNPILGQELKALDAQIKGLIASTQAVADDPRMFPNSTSNYILSNFAGLVPGSYKGSNKTEKIVDIVDNIVNNLDKVIIFTKFRTSAILLQDQLKKDLKINALLYTGKEGETERDSNINLFKNDDAYPVLVATEAGAEGLNLAHAKYVINFNLPDTAAIYTQRIGRIRRVSSTFNNIIVYNLLTANSKDTERWDNIQKNKDLEGALVNINQVQQQALLNEMNGG